MLQSLGSSVSTWICKSRNLNFFNKFRQAMCMCMRAWLHNGTRFCNTYFFQGLCRIPFFSSSVFFCLLSFNGRNEGKHSYAKRFKQKPHTSYALFINHHNTNIFNDAPFTQYTLTQSACLRWFFVVGIYVMCNVFNLMNKIAVASLEFFWNWSRICNLRLIHSVTCFWVKSSSGFSHRNYSIIKSSVTASNTDGSHSFGCNSFLMATLMESRDLLSLNFINRIYVRSLCVIYILTAYQQR